jgi:hypothetical protein
MELKINYQIEAFSHAQKSNVVFNITKSDINELCAFLNSVYSDNPHMDVIEVRARVYNETMNQFVYRRVHLLAEEIIEQRFITDYERRVLRTAQLELSA